MYVCMYECMCFSMSPYVSPCALFPGLKKTYVNQSGHICQYAPLLCPLI